MFRLSGELGIECKNNAHFQKGVTVINGRVKDNQIKSKQNSFIFYVSWTCLKETVIRRELNNLRKL